MTRILPISLAILAACSDGVKTFSSTELTIDTPVDGAEVYAEDTVTMHASSANKAGIRALVLRAGDRELATCAGGDGAAFESVACEKTFDTRDFAAQQVAGTLKLSAEASDANGGTERRSVTISIVPLKVEFLLPQPDGAELPATVKGTSNLSINASGELPIQQVQVTFDSGTPLHLFTTIPGSERIEWKAFVGLGQHVLDAEATDVQGRKAHAKLKILVVDG